MIARCAGWVLNVVYKIKKVPEDCGAPYSPCKNCNEYPNPEPDDLISEDEMYKLFVTDPVDRMAIEIHE